MDEQLEQLAKLKRDKHEQLVASTATAGKSVRVKGRQQVVATAEIVEEYGSFELFQHGIMPL